MAIEEIKDQDYIVKYDSDSRVVDFIGLLSLQGPKEYAPITELLNKIADDIYRNEDHVPERLRELLGHTPFEVIVGAILGMATAYIFHYRLAGGAGAF